MNPKTRKIIRWIARIWAAFMAAMILFIFIGNAAVDGIGPIFHLTFRESLMMAAFVIVFVGLILAWKWECLGGWTIIGRDRRLSSDNFPAMCIEIMISIIFPY